MSATPRQPSDLAILVAARRALKRCGNSGEKFYSVIPTVGRSILPHHIYGARRVRDLVNVGLLAYGNRARGFAILTDAGRAAIGLDANRDGDIASA